MYEQVDKQRQLPSASTPSVPVPVGSNGVGSFSYWASSSSKGLMPGGGVPQRPPQTESRKCA